MTDIKRNESDYREIKGWRPMIGVRLIDRADLDRLDEIAAASDTKRGTIAARLLHEAIARASR